MSNKFLDRFREYINSTQFNAIKIGLASPDKIRSLSYGEVKKIETINYRTLKPERDGLFCARIFGPVKDWECNCGKYKRMKHRGITCEKCGVEVIQARVRRERMGHIELVAPVCHIWYLKGIPSYLSLIMDMPIKDLEKVIYFDSYLVIKQGKSPYPEKTLLSSIDYENYLDLRPDDFEFKAEIGAQAIKYALSNLDLHDLIKSLQIDYEKTTSVAVRHKMMRRIKVLSSLIQGNLRPEWMIFTVLPVLPPDLRPLVPIDGGRFASSDLNELYRRVINRNIRLERLIEIEAPSVIVKNEKRMLQEAVDALIDNGRRGQPVRGSNRRQLKSLSEILRGKQGRFRQNLLGKRVDYSGRSVIVVDPTLKLNQCGLPKIMALELFKSHVYAGLLEREEASNLRFAKRMVEELDPKVWDVLEDVVRDYPVILNRAPTLHKLGIQAFYPILVDGKAIKVHPLVCAAFNADFDGDQMAVHIPLSKNAKEECKNLVLSTKSLLSSANGKPVAVPTQDMILGLYYITKVRFNSKGENILFANISEVIAAYQMGQVDLHAKIKLRLNKDIIETTVGRILLFDALPKGSDILWINRIMTKSDFGKLIERIYYTFGPEETVKCLDNIKKLGFYNSTMAGISFAINNLLVPENKDSLVLKAEKEVQKIEQLYREGVITNGERYSKIIAIWSQINKEVAVQMTKAMAEEDKKAYLNENKSFYPFNSVYMMLESGAKGSKDQVQQLAGMRGLMSKPSGEIMETPVKNNFKHGLTVFEYFISTHGARKGQADTALKTANSGYLTRRLVDVAQDVVITIYDCKTSGYIELEDLKEAGDTIYSLAHRAYGRVVALDIKDSITSDIILQKGHIITKEDIIKINNSSISKIPLRSSLTCQAKRGICALCYGFDLSKVDVINIGSTVGIIAAQSIGEPGTQLTMRTFHIGGTASVSDQSFYTAKHEGTVKLHNVKYIENRDKQNVVLSRKAKLLIISDDGRELQKNELEYGSILLVKDGQKVKVGTKLCEWDINNKVILTEKAGKIKFIDLIENVTMQEHFDEITNKSTKFILEHKGDKYQPAIAIENKDGQDLALYYLPINSYLMVNNGQEISAGDIIVKTPREISKTKDITGGLPKIAELFEARMPKEPAILSDIDGEVVFAGLYRNLRKISVINSQDSHDYFIPRSKQLNVANGDKVNAGDKLTTGTLVLHDILRILGPEVLQKYLLDQIQAIYRLQGIDINDRHVELIIRQMLRKVKVVDPGDSDFLIGDRVDRIHFNTVNNVLINENKKPASAKPILMGITLASLGTESFISAASFQETTRILSEAAILGQVDHLYGLKENVIIGKLIPAGTGIKSFKKKYIEKKDNIEKILTEYKKNS